MEDLIDKLYSVLISSLDVEELYDAFKKIRALIVDEQNHDVYDEDHENLFIKIYTKYAFLLYYDHKYSDEKYADSIAKLESVKNTASKIDFKKNVEAITYAIDCTKNIHRLMVNYLGYRAKIQDLLNNNGDEASISALRKELEEIYNSLNVTIHNIMSPGIELINPYEFARKDIIILFDAIDKFLAEKEIYKAKRLLDSVGTPFQNYFSFVYGYVPDINLDAPGKSLTSTYVVHTPIRNEANLFVHHYFKAHKMNAYYLDLKKMSGFDLEEVKSLFRYLKTNNIALFIDNYREYKSKFKVQFTNLLLDLGRTVKKIFIYDQLSTDEISQELNEFVSAENEFSILDLGVLYLSMPTYGKVVELLKKELETDDKDGLLAETIKSKFTYIGFYGLNEIVRNIRADKEIDYVRIGNRFTLDNNTNALKEYVAGLPNVSLFIDYGWGKIFEDPDVDKSKSSIKFDYDDYSEYNLDNLKAINNLKLSMLIKTGLMARYIMLSRYDRDIWPTWDIQTKKERAIKMVNILYEMFEIGYKPVVKFEQKKDNNWGLFDPNSKEITLNSSIIDKYEDFYQTIYHETFHAFQHHCIETKFKQWYFDDFGITRSRIDEWNQNFSVYMSADKLTYEAYRYQIVESDANSYAAEAFNAGNNYWHTINWIKD